MVTLQLHRFDAVAVCNGHNTVPYCPDIQGLDLFDRPVLHSHLYRNATLFVGKTVVVLGMI